VIGVDSGAGVVVQVMDEAKTAEMEAAITGWLERIVIGLGLCPFASRVVDDARLRIRISTATSEEQALTDLQEELLLLAAADTRELETSLLALPDLAGDFDAFNQMLALVDLLLDEAGWHGRFQVASFHPDYRFADTQPDAPGNLTNRSPVPLLHILRETSVAAAIESIEDPAAIPTRNIRVMESLDATQLDELFPWLSRS